MAFMGSIWLNIRLTSPALTASSQPFTAPQSQLVHHDLQGLLSKRIIDEFDSFATNGQLDPIRANDPRCYTNHSS